MKIVFGICFIGVTLIFVAIGIGLIIYGYIKKSRPVEKLVEVCAHLIEVPLHAENQNTNNEYTGVAFNVETIPMWEYSFNNISYKVPYGSIAIKDDYTNTAKTYINPYHPSKICSPDEKDDYKFFLRFGYIFAIFGLVMMICVIVLLGIIFPFM